MFYDKQWCMHISHPASFYFSTKKLDAKTTDTEYCSLNDQMFFPICFYWKKPQKLFCNVFMEHVHNSGDVKKYKFTGQHLRLTLNY